jgi:hypothetical protein
MTEHFDTASPHYVMKQKANRFDWLFLYAFTKFFGISSQVLPSSVLPALFFCTPPHA